MKIRTDFVTNSSSSSFTLIISFQLTNGKKLKFEGNGASYECGSTDYFNGDAIVKVSPKQLGNASSVDELINLLAQGVFDRDLEDESETPIFASSYPITSSYDGKKRDAYSFVKKIKKEVKSMDDIKSITIEGTEESDETYYRSCTYDLVTKKFTGKIRGSEPSSRGGNSGGDLAFWTTWSWSSFGKECDIKQIDEDE